MSSTERHLFTLLVDWLGVKVTLYISLYVSLGIRPILFEWVQQYTIHESVSEDTSASTGAETSIETKTIQIPVEIYAYDCCVYEYAQYGEKYSMEHGGSYNPIPHTVRCT
jgi:hypothetical protein